MKRNAADRDAMRGLGPAWRRLAWLALAALLAGCSGGSPGRITSIDGLVDGVARAYCDWQFRCCSMPAIVALTGSKYGTREECLGYVGLELRDLLGAQRLAVHEGRAVLDSNAAAACVREIGDRACSLAMPGPLAPTPMAALRDCRHLVVGHVAIGGRCFGPYDCASGSRCALLPNQTLPPDDLNSAFSGGLALAGDCVATQKAGDICNSDSDCDSDQRLYCRTTDFRCAPPGKEGESCSVTSGNLNPDTATSPSCDSTARLFCDPSSNRCRRLPRDGDSCLGFESFGLGLSPCDPDPSLMLSCVGMGFNGNGVCKTAGVSGDACGGTGLPPCGPDLVCAGAGATLGTCDLAPGVGESCINTGLCRAPAACDRSTGTCLVPGPQLDGAPCQSNADCMSLLCGFGPSQLACLPSGQGVSCSGVSTGTGFGGMGGSGTGFGGSGGAAGAAGSTGTGPGGAAGAPATGGGGGTGGMAVPPDCKADLGTTDDTVSDFEDGSGAVLPSGGRSGAWRSSDRGGGGCMYAPPAGAAVMATLIPGGRCASRFALHLAGAGCSSVVSLGADLAGTATGRTSYDLGPFTAISFWARVDPRATTNVVRVSVPDLDTDGQAGGCVPVGATPCDDNFGQSLALGLDWQRFVVGLAGLTQEGWGVAAPAFDPTQALGIRFEVPPDTEFGVWIDDVTLVR